MQEKEEFFGEGDVAWVERARFMALSSCVGDLLALIAAWWWGGRSPCALSPCLFLLAIGECFVSDECVNGSCSIGGGGGGEKGEVALEVRDRC